MAQIARARQLRRKRTWAEKALWRLLRDRRFSGYKFRRQHPAGKYVLDFYCAEAKLALETDGYGHGFPEQQQRDATRDEFLLSEGILVKRIWNWQLRRQLEWVRYNLWHLLQQRAPHPGNMQPAKPVTSRVLNPDRSSTIHAPVASSAPHPSPLPFRRGEGEEGPLGQSAAASRSHAAGSQSPRPVGQSPSPRPVGQSPSPRPMGQSPSPRPMGESPSPHRMGRGLG